MSKKTQKYLEEKQREWIAADADVMEREKQMLVDLVEYYDVERGDAIESASGIKIAITKFELRDYCGHSRSMPPIVGMPLLIITGTKITKKNTLHQAGHQIGFNTSYDFHHIGRFQIGDYSYEKPRGLMQPQRPELAVT